MVNNKVNNMIPNNRNIFTKSANFFPDLFLIYCKKQNLVLSSTSSEGFFPDLTGLSIEEANNILTPLLKDNEKEVFRNKWAISGMLKVDEIYTFDSSFKATSGEVQQYQFQCKGMNNIGGDGNAYVIILGNKLMCENNSTLEEFLHLAAHDLHAPLRKLISFTDLLISKLPTDAGNAIKPYKEKIEHSVTEMRGIVNRLALYSSLDCPKETFEPVDLNNIVHQVLAGMNEEIPPSTTTNIDQLPTIDAIPTQIKELFRQLFQNAFLYRNKASAVNIMVKSIELANGEQFLHDHSNPGHYYKIEVIDNGIGINTENMDKIFQPFTRLQGKSEYPGHGFGLAISKKIIANHKGAISVESDENGSTFILILPSKQPS